MFGFKLQVGNHTETRTNQHNSVQFGFYQTPLIMSPDSTQIHLATPLHVLTYQPSDAREFSLQQRMGQNSLLKTVQPRFHRWLPQASSPGASRWCLTMPWWFQELGYTTKIQTSTQCPVIQKFGVPAHYWFWTYTMTCTTFDLSVTLGQRKLSASHTRWCKKQRSLWRAISGEPPVVPFPVSPPLMSSQTDSQWVAAWLPVLKISKPEPSKVH